MRPVDELHIEDFENDEAVQCDVAYVYCPERHSWLHPDLARALGTDSFPEFPPVEVPS